MARGTGAVPRGLIAVALAAFLLAIATSQTGGPQRASAQAVPPAPPMQRIVSARVHHTRISVVRNSNAHRVGHALASLRPTWVTGLIRYAKGQHPTYREVRAWKIITRTVRHSSPAAQFDVILNAEQYRNGGELLRAMHRVRKRLNNDGWFFDFYSTAFRVRPRMIRAAIASAHAHGEWIGGNVFGITDKHPEPLRSDFLAVQDFRRLTLNLPAVRRLAGEIPVVYHLNNNPAHGRSGGCRFIRAYTTVKRQKLIRRRARQQAKYGFRVSYPALFPECVQKFPGRRPDFLYSYNLFRDPPMRRTVAHLLDRYD